VREGSLWEGGKSGGRRDFENLEARALQAKMVVIQKLEEGTGRKNGNGGHELFKKVPWRCMGA